MDQVQLAYDNNNIKELRNLCMGPDNVFAKHVLQYFENKTKNQIVNNYLNQLKKDEIPCGKNKDRMQKLTDKQVIDKIKYIFDHMKNRKW